MLRFKRMAQGFVDFHIAKGKVPFYFAYMCDNRNSVKKCRCFVAANEDGSPRGGPLTSKQRELKSQCHVAFDRIWKSAGKLQRYSRTFSLPRNPRIADQKRAVLGKFRRIAYFWMAEKLHRPESDVHLGVMTDVRLMESFKSVAMATRIEDVDRWWNEEGGEQTYGEELKVLMRQSRVIKSQLQGRKNRDHKNS